MARRCDGNWPKCPISSHKTEKLLYLARSFVSFGIRRQALTEGTVLRLAKAWSMTGCQGVTSFLSYYKITLSIGLASGTERSTYRFNPACRLCRIKKRFCICSMSFVDCYRGSFASLRNRTADRRGRQNACLWQTWQGHYLRVMSWSSQNINVFWSLQKNIYLKESELWRKVISNKIIVTLVTQGLPSSFLSRTVA